MGSGGSLNQVGPLHICQDQLQQCSIGRVVHVPDRLSSRCAKEDSARVKGKLAPRYVGPYQILAKRGEVAYQLSLLEGLSAVHDVFHVSQLKKCLRVPEE